MSLRRLFVVVTILIVVGVRFSHAEEGPEPGRTGSFTVTFSESDPRSSLKVANRRLGKSGKFVPDEYDFKLADESYQVFVPENYDGTKSHGLIAWISSGPKGSVPGQYEALMEKHRLIWIGANMSGNSRQPHWIRAMLAIDAVFNMKQLYKIDPERIYVSGVSGGGRMSSMVAPPYPDVFTGGACYVIGCNPIRHIPIDDNKGFPGFWHEPDPAIIALAKKRRFVLLTGSGDYNKPGTKRVYEAYRKDGFPHVTYLEEPGLDHAMPSPEWFEKAILTLDKPLRRPSSKPNPEKTKTAEPDTRGYRTWTSGRHKTRASLVSFENSIALLKTPTGETVQVPYAKLSAVDQQFLDNLP